MAPVTFSYRSRFYNRGVYERDKKYHPQPSSAVLSRPAIWGFTAKTTTYQKCTTQKLHSTVYNINKRHHQQIRSFAVAVGTEDRVPQIVTVQEAEATQSPLREKRAMGFAIWSTVGGRGRGSSDGGAVEEPYFRQRQRQRSRSGGTRDAKVVIWSTVGGRRSSDGGAVEEPYFRQRQRQRSRFRGTRDAEVAIWSTIGGRRSSDGGAVEEPYFRQRQRQRSRSGGTRTQRSRSGAVDETRDAEAAVEEVVEPATQRKNGEQEEGEAEEREAVEVLI
ncbi:hypothetical protein LR48_Vigan06g078700 [Vigna angularis]|uniref:Uncharacterized protein n=1 Tax=Phaseolus angularis TaxID=3914 RepID=A0A0L9US04_PHAAN|nr:hypothetical protein LR48_Vigan06g078700 [Vigna angularis]